MLPTTTPQMQPQMTSLHSLSSQMQQQMQSMMSPPMQMVQQMPAMASQMPSLVSQMQSSLGQMSLSHVPPSAQHFASQMPMFQSQLANALPQPGAQSSSLMHSTLADLDPVSVTSPSPVNLELVYECINQVPNPITREQAVVTLCRYRDAVPDLAPMIWHSCGTVASLLQDVISIYPAVIYGQLTATDSNRACNALTLLLCLASHQETRSPFLQANIPLYLYPFLNTTHRTRPFDYLRLSSLGVIGALVKVTYSQADEQEVITFLLTSEVIPLCLQIMENGNELAKTVATFILQKILLDDNGLNYICQTYDRFSHVAMILGKMVLSLITEPSLRLLKHVIRCYMRLSDNARAREALRQCLPDQLRDSTFSNILLEDHGAAQWLMVLLRNLDTPLPSAEMSGGM